MTRWNGFPTGILRMGGIQNPGVYPNFASWFPCVTIAIMSESSLMTGAAVFSGATWQDAGRDSSNIPRSLFFNAPDTRNKKA